MAHFSDSGAQCADPYCRQRDFLPLHCDACGNSYCSAHFRYEVHECAKGRAARAGRDKRAIVCPFCAKALPLTALEDENAVWELHVASGGCQPALSKPRCPVDGCKEKLTTLNTFACGSCGKKVCMKHRFEDAHCCKALAQGPRIAVPQDAQKTCREFARSCGARGPQQGSGHLQRPVKHLGCAGVTAALGQR
mmetsp:Transcript_70557/g.194996  ORF Transcript_70557/g.194996 Transcript_70557/m.194996 type:complete len:193 (+) Transcript_70557:113-691(+)|eukprot:CAMPEP_0179026462 /NCGR_PEP_ID=MMETSP0796-20121207/8525_1 /TAXON_ID=73915 /ORGANISM="Pyrodinium bahamense, Strain pbaha01" /LENGTH=192 /DNA_ID=CAMNT_0020722539 /DNA_START=104 /DNA_END=682 /DNA_ORIENTATION=+